MRIGFLGWGKTGREAILPFLEDTDVEVSWVLRSSPVESAVWASRLLLMNRDEGEVFGMDRWEGGRFLDKHPVDVVVDFSSEQGMERYRVIAEKGIRIVSALSGWGPAGIAHLQYACAKTAVLSSPNITLGINFLIAVSAFLKELTDEPDIQITEEHFSTKKGRSGTSLQIAKALNIDPDENIHSVRAGGILGRHEVIFGFPYQTIRLSHETIHRAAFGKGALSAARWVSTKEPGLYTMDDLMREKLSSAFGPYGKATV